MQLTDTERHVLEVYHAGEGKVTVADVARECDIPDDKAGEASRTLASLGLLVGDRNRKITENGIAILEGLDIPENAPATVVEQSRESAVVDLAEGRMITDILGEQFGIKPDKLIEVVSRNVIQVGRTDEPPTMAEVYHVLNVMREFDLNPWMKEVHAFRHKGKLQVMLGYDGWVKKALKYPGYLGPEYLYAPEMVETPDGKGKKTWEWVQCTLHSRGRIPTVVRAFLDEWYVPMSDRAREPGPWQKFTRNRLRQKSYCMAVREHCGIALWDETDREQMMYADMGVAEVVSEKTERAQLELSDQLAANEAANKPSTAEELGSLDPGNLGGEE